MICSVSFARIVKRHAATACLAAGVLFGLPALAAMPPVDKPAPTFQAVDSNGKIHALEQYRGRTVILEWTNHGCPFVQKHYGTENMQGMQKDAKTDDMVWLSVISSAPGTQGHVSGAEANELTESRDAAPTAVLLDEDGTVGRMYGAVTTPQMVVIDPDGLVRYTGGIDDKPTTRWEDVETARNHVRAALADMAAGREVEVKTARPYGCSVKYGS